MFSVNPVLACYLPCSSTLRKHPHHPPTVRSVCQSCQRFPPTDGEDSLWFCPALSLLWAGFLQRGPRCFPIYRAQELCESRAGRPGVPACNSPHGFCGRKPTLNFIGHRTTQSSGAVWKSKWTSWASPSLVVLTVSVDIKQHRTQRIPEFRSCVKVEVDVLGFSVPNSPYGLCGHKATQNSANTRVQELCESRGGRPGLIILHGLCGLKATMNFSYFSVLCFSCLTLTLQDF